MRREPGAKLLSTSVFPRRARFAATVSLLLCTALVGPGLGADGARAATRPAPKWTAVASSGLRAPVLGSASKLLRVSCIKSTNCFAVGGYHDSFPDKTFFGHWNGRTWSVTVAAGQLGSTLSYPLGISCVTSKFCVVVGERTARFGNGLSPLIVQWNGKRWTEVPSPALPNHYGGLLDVSCSAPTSCFAVGYYFGNIRTLIERWDGHRWSISPSPNVSASSLDVLHGVTCVAATHCFAVGTSNGKQTLIERWNGKRWSIVASPNRKVKSNTLLDVSCAARTSCFAVGVAEGSVATTLTEYWDGTRWSVVPSPTPDEPGLHLLLGVSCSSATSCVAVGTSTSSSIGPLAERWDGTKWSITPVPQRDGEISSELLGVSCVAGPTCLAVGSVSDDIEQFGAVDRYS